MTGCVMAIKRDETMSANPLLIEHSQDGLHFLGIVC